MLKAPPSGTPGHKAYCAAVNFDRADMYLYFTETDGTPWATFLVRQNSYVSIDRAAMLGGGGKPYKSSAKVGRVPGGGLRIDTLHKVMWEAHDRGPEFASLLRLLPSGGPRRWHMLAHNILYCHYGGRYAVVPYPWTVSITNEQIYDALEKKLGD